MAPRAWAKARDGVWGKGTEGRSHTRCEFQFRFLGDGFAFVHAIYLCTQSCDLAQPSGQVITQRQNSHKYYAMDRSYSTDTKSDFDRSWFRIRIVWQHGLPSRVVTLASSFCICIRWDCAQKIRMAQAGVGVFLAPNRTGQFIVTRTTAGGPAQRYPAYSLILTFPMYCM